MLVVWLVAITVFGDTGKPRTDVNLRTAPNTRGRETVLDEFGVTSALDNTWGAGLAFNGFDLGRGERFVAGSGAEGWPGEKVRRNHSRCAAGARSYCH